MFVTYIYGTANVRKWSSTVFDDGLLQLLTVIGKIQSNCWSNLRVVGVTDLLLLNLLQASPIMTYQNLLPQHAAKSKADLTPGHKIMQLEQYLWPVQCLLGLPRPSSNSNMAGIDFFHNLFPLTWRYNKLPLQVRSPAANSLKRSKYCYKWCGTNFMLWLSLLNSSLRIT